MKVNKEKKWKTRRAVSGKDRLERLEKAYTDYCSGKKNSLKELAYKYRLHIPDISKYITFKFEQSKENKLNKLK